MGKPVGRQVMLKRSTYERLHRFRVEELGGASFSAAVDKLLDLWEEAKGAEARYAGREEAERTCKTCGGRITWASRIALTSRDEWIIVRVCPRCHGPAAKALITRPEPR